MDDNHIEQREEEAQVEASSPLPQPIQTSSQGVPASPWLYNVQTGKLDPEVFFLVEKICSELLHKYKDSIDKAVEKTLENLAKSKTEPKGLSRTAYVWQAAKNTCFSMLKELLSLKKVLNNKDTRNEVVAYLYKTSKSADVILQDKQLFQRIYQAINKLRPEERDVILLWMNNVSTKDACERLDIKEHQWNYRVSSAIEKLRKYLIDFDPEPEGGVNGSGGHSSSPSPNSDAPSTEERAGEKALAGDSLTAKGTQMNKLILQLLQTPDNEDVDECKSLELDIALLQALNFEDAEELKELEVVSPGAMMRETAKIDSKGLFDPNHAPLVASASGVQHTNYALDQDTKETLVKPTAPEATPQDAGKVGLGKVFSGEAKESKEAEVLAPVFALNPLIEQERPDGVVQPKAANDNGPNHPSRWKHAVFGLAAMVLLAVGLKMWYPATTGHPAPQGTPLVILDGTKNLISKVHEYYDKFKSIKSNKLITSNYTNDINEISKKGTVFDNSIKNKSSVVYKYGDLPLRAATDDEQGKIELHAGGLIFEHDPSVDHLYKDTKYRKIELSNLENPVIINPTGTKYRVIADNGFGVLFVDNGSVEIISKNKSSYSIFAIHKYVYIIMPSGKTIKYIYDADYNKYKNQIPDSIKALASNMVNNDKDY